MIKETEINHILEIYLSVRSIERTAEITGFCKNTVNKHVRQYSSQKVSSRYNARPVLKIEPETGKVIRRYKSTGFAAKRNRTTASNINQAIKGHTATAVGYAWRYESEWDSETFEPFTLPLCVQTRTLNASLGLMCS